MRFPVALFGWAIAFPGLAQRLFHDKRRSGASIFCASKSIDRFSEWTGVAVAWLMVPLIVAVVYEVVARYAFGAPLPAQ